MVQFLITWLLASLALLITAYIIPGIKIEGIWTAFFASAALGLINAIIKPVFVFLTLPFTILTLGIFLLFINPIMLWIAGSINPKFKVEGFFSAVLGSIGLTIVSGIINYLLGR